MGKRFLVLTLFVLVLVLAYRGTVAAADSASSFGGMPTDVVLEMTMNPVQVKSGWLSELGGGMDKPLQVRLGKQKDGNAEHAIQITGENGTVVWLANSVSYDYEEGTKRIRKQEFEFVSYKTVEGGKAVKQKTDGSHRTVRVVVRYGQQNGRVSAVLFAQPTAAPGKEPLTNVYTYTSGIEAAGGTEVTTDESPVVAFQDPKLEAAVRIQLLKPEGKLTEDDLASLRYFEANEAGITNLEGLQYAVNLTSLSLRNNEIADVGVLSHIKRLATVQLAHNRLTDISPLAGLTELTLLDVTANSIADLKPLNGLMKLNRLYASGNQIRNIAPLAGLTRLESLALDGNRVHDLTDLSGLTRMKILTVSDNEVVDLSAIHGMTGLEMLVAGNNTIGDISPVALLTHLRHLDVSNNRLKSVDALAGCIEMEYLDISGNMIAEINALDRLTRVNLFNANYNRIADVMVLSHWKKLSTVKLYANKVTDLAAFDPNVVERGGRLGLLDVRGNPLPAGAYDVIEKLKKQQTFHLEFDLPVTATPVVPVKPTEPFGSQAPIDGVGPTTDTAADGEVNIIIDGDSLPFEQPPVFVGNRLFEPVRNLFEALGTKVDWLAETGTVVAVKESRQVRLTVGSRDSDVNGQPFELDEPAQIIGGQTFVPLRFVSEALGVSVAWEPYTRTVILRSKGNTVGLFPVEVKKAGNVFPEYGYIDREGRMAIEPTYLQAYPFSNGLAHVTTGIKNGFITPDGRWAIEMGKYDCFKFVENMCLVKEWSTQKYGYMDIKGNVVIEPKYDSAFDFSDGYAVVSVRSASGYNDIFYIDKQGKRVFEESFAEAMSFSEGIAAVLKRNGGWALIDRTGHAVQYTRYRLFGGVSNGWVAVQTKPTGNMKADSFLNTNGVLMATGPFDRVQPFREGYAAIEVGGKWGYIDAEGKLVMEPRFSRADGVSEGLAVVNEGADGKAGYFDPKTGLMAIEAAFDNAEPFNGGLARVVVGGKVRYIDKSGQFVGGE